MTPVTYYNEAASAPYNDASRNAAELHFFTQSSETGLGSTTDATVLFSGMRQVLILVSLSTHSTVNPKYMAYPHN